MAVESRVLLDKLQSLARSHGVDLVGVADMGPARGLICHTGGDFLAGFPRAVSLLIHTSDTVVDRVVHREDRRQHLASALGYRAHSAQVGVILERAMTGLVFLLESEGWQAYPVFPGRADDEAQAGLVSQKIAAHLSGLGWIGKNCLLVSPRFGPRLRLATILTDALLPAGEPAPDRCGTCRECVDICPAGAIQGRPFSPEEPREARFDAPSCAAYCEGEWGRLGVKDRTAPGHVCGLCLWVCPYGRKGNSKEDFE